MAKFVIERFVSVPVNIEIEADSFEDAIQKHFEYGKYDLWDYRADADYFAINQINGKSNFQEDREMVYAENADTGGSGFLAYERLYDRMTALIGLLEKFWYYKYIKNSGTALNGKRVFYFSTRSSAVTSLPIGYGLILGRLLNHN